MLLQSHDGTVHLLPAVPDDWAASGGVRGLRAQGGFELDFTWANGEVTRVAVRSTLGDNLRIRVPNELVLSGGAALATGSGPNPNPFFAVPTIRSPVISPQADLNEVVLEPTFVFDLPTEAGQSYLLVAAP
jgi:alpha-L-fucosidase 2